MDEIEDAILQSEENAKEVSLTDQPQPNEEDLGEGEEEAGEEEEASEEGEEEEEGNDDGEEEAGEEEDGEEEGAGEEGKDEEGEAEEEKPDTELLSINSFLGKDYKSVDAAKESLKAANAAAKAEVDSLKSQVASLEEQIDPLKYFGGNEKAYILQQLKNKRPDLDPSALTRVMSDDLVKMSSVDILALQIKLENPGAVDGPGQATAKDLVYDEYGIDPEDPSDISAMQKSKLDIEANKARKDFSSLSKDIEVPKVDDLTAKRQDEITKSTEAWSPIVKEELAKNLDKITFTAKGKDGKIEQVFEFNVSDEYKSAIATASDKIIADLASRGVEVTDETKAEIVKAYKDQFVLQNFTTIMKAYTNDQVAKMTVEEFNKYHNTNPDGKGRVKTPKRKKSARQVSKEKAEADIMDDLS